MLAKLYRLKEDPVTKKAYAKPTSYLGAQIKEYKYSDDKSHTGPSAQRNTSRKL